MLVNGYIEHRADHIVIHVPAFGFSFPADTSLKDPAQVAVEIFEYEISHYYNESIKVTWEWKNREQFTLTLPVCASVTSYMLRSLRSSKDISQRQLAKNAGHSSHSAVGNYEKGKSIPGLEKIEEFARALGFELVLDFIPIKN